MLIKKQAKEKKMRAKYKLEYDNKVLFEGNGKELLEYFGETAKDSTERNAKVIKIKNEVKKIGIALYKLKYEYELYYKEKLIEESETFEGICSRTGYSTTYWLDKIGEEHDDMIIKRKEVWY